METAREVQWEKRFPPEGDLWQVAGCPHALTVALRPLMFVSQEDGPDGTDWPIFWIWRLSAAGAKLLTRKMLLPHTPQTVKIQPALSLSLVALGTYFCWKMLLGSQQQDVP